MENAVEALKIAFGVMMFVLALTLSISSLSKANSAVEAIVSLNDRESEYIYVKPSEDLTRIVGVESIVPAMYRAYQESFEIYFYKANGDPLIIYYETDFSGNRKKDEYGAEIGINYIDGEQQGKEEHLNRILGNPNNVEDKYKNQLNADYDNGLYAFLTNNKFKEELGEYYLNDSENTPDANKTKKRVITYTLVD